MGATLALIGGMFSIFGLGPIQTFFGISISGTRIGLLSVFISLSLLVIGSLIFPDNDNTKE